ncbi:LOXE3 isomerase, partial [Alectura lathami]|nr:LOXE3 isomerase [Alectura lathami]
MREPPPQSKAPLSEAEFLRALPAVNTTCRVLGVLWVLRNEPLDMVRPPDPHPASAQGTPALPKGPQRPW